MKKIYYLLLLLVLSAGCAKNDSVNPSELNNSISRQLINEVIKMASNKEAQKLSYKLLSNDEKAILWRDQIDFYLDSELSAMQKEKLNELKSIISPKIFDKSYFEKHYAAFAKQWSTSAAEIFPREVL